MGHGLLTSNKIFFAISFIFELWFILMYALDYGYKYDAVESTALAVNGVR
jgi:hypothetical protein